MFKEMRRRLNEDNASAQFKATVQRLTAHIDEIENLSPVLNGTTDYPQKYETAGQELFERFKSKADRKFHNLGVQHGFKVCLRLGFWAVKAYPDYIAKSGDMPDPEELGDILGSSYQSAVTPFSNVPGFLSQSREKGFGLLNRGCIPAYEELPFLIAPADEGSAAVLQLKAYSLDISTREAKPPSQYRNPRCPAAGQVLMAVLEKTREVCTVNPHLYPADVAGIAQPLEAPPIKQTQVY